jgi:molybdate transport system ATP-binding protein
MKDAGRGAPHGATRAITAFGESRTPIMLPLISLAHVNLHLQGHHVLKDVTWQLDAGEHWAFTGRNGSGKSSLLRVIRGDQWIDPDGGTRTYAFDGVATRGVISARAQIGVVTPEQQERYTRLELPITGRAVVASGLDDTIYLHRSLTASEAPAVDAILERLHLERFANVRMRALSFGQMRRILIARALVRTPRILVLDEFTSGLDRDARREILTLLDELAPTVQLIFASHRAEEFVAAVSHRATLRDGHIVERGTGRPARTAVAARTMAPPVAAARNGAIPIVALENASVYRGTTLVLEGVDWSIAPGEHTALFGENGSGKSTFAALVAGTLHPTADGEVRRFGRTPPFNLWRVKERVVHVSDDLQTHYTVNETVTGVILSGFASSVGLWREPTAGERAIADDLIARLELEPLRERRFLGLSFGERRKVLVARSLVRPPALLILDEVWNGLDVQFHARFGALLAELATGGTTLLLIAHHEEDLPDLIVRRYAIAERRVREVT